MNYLSIRSWSRYQHYGNVRYPIWIKLYSHLLDDREDRALPLPTRLLWRQLLLLAARYGNAIPNDNRRIAAEAHLALADVVNGLVALTDLGWIKETKTPRRASSSNSKRRTGWRFVRGTHSGTYRADPEGMDIPPYAARNATTERRAA